MPNFSFSPMIPALPISTLFPYTTLFRSMMAGAADLHHVNLGRVFALLAAILAVLRRGATAGRARALVLRLLVRHLNLPPFFDSSRSGSFAPSFIPRRHKGQARRRDEGGGMRDEEDAFFHPSSLRPHPFQGAGWTTMRTRSLPTWISSGVPSCMGMVLPLPLITSGGT